MKLLEHVRKSLGWRKAESVGASCLGGNPEPCSRRGTGRLNLCPKHKAAYRREQHRLAMKRVNAKRALMRAAKRASKAVKKSIRRVRST